MRVVAAAAGIVSNMRLQPGERVERGVPVFSLIESRPMWIEANFKETQLTHMREGQEVTVVRRCLPSDKVARPRRHHRARHQGRVRHPSRRRTRAARNWVKVVQRVPVLISLDAAPDGQTPLRAGMTVTARVDTGHVRSLSALR